MGHCRSRVVRRTNHVAVLNNPPFAIIFSLAAFLVHNLLQDLKNSLIRCAETLQYEASALPATQMDKTVLPEKLSAKQQKRSRLDGGVELDGAQRQFLPVTAPELPGHHELEDSKANAEIPKRTSSSVEQPARRSHRLRLCGYYTAAAQRICSITANRLLLNPHLRRCLRRRPHSHHHHNY